MLDKIKNFFGKAEDPPQDDGEAAHVAAAALLMEAALSDGVYANVEEARIVAILSGAFGLDDAKAARILSLAEEAAEEAVDHFRFTNVVKQHLSRKDRVRLIEHLWSVVLSDGEQAAIEDAFIRRVAPLLGVSDRDRALARQRAEKAFTGEED